jgi:hypothetical protein
MKLLRDTQINFVDGRARDWDASRTGIGPMQRINERSLGLGYRRTAW